MFKPVQIAPSILSADFLNFGEDIAKICEGGAGLVHVDVMDGHFVPNLTMGVPLVKALAKNRSAFARPIDVHLMIDNPLVELPWFLDAGMSAGDICSVHAEVLSEGELMRAIDMIHEAGVGASVAIKPKTPAGILESVIDKLEMVLVMSVEPGFSGQSYIEGSEKKVAQVVDMARAKNCSPMIQVDGGIGCKTAPLVCAEGADVLVCGNAVFGAADPVSALQEVRNIAEEARIAALDEKR